MDQSLALLESTDELLRTAEANLKKLKKLELPEGTEAKLEQLIRKYQEVAQEIHVRKRRLLGVLVNLAFLAKKVEHPTCLAPCFTYVILSQKEISVRKGDIRGYTQDQNLRGIYTIHDFLLCTSLLFYDFCESMLRGIKLFLANTPHEHAEEIKRLTEFTAELKQLKTDFPQEQ